MHRPSTHSGALGWTGRLQVRTHALLVASQGAQGISCPERIAPSGWGDTRSADLVHSAPFDPEVEDMLPDSFKKNHSRKRLIHLLREHHTHNYPHDSSCGAALGTHRCSASHTHTHTHTHTLALLFCFISRAGTPLQAVIGYHCLNSHEPSCSAPSLFSASLSAGPGAARARRACSSYIGIGTLSLPQL